MIRKILLFALCVVFMLSACNSIDRKDGKSDVPYIIAKNYFVNNDIGENDLPNYKITSQIDFDKYIGQATLEGESGKPTPIDFSKQYVILVVGSLTDIYTEWSVVSLKQKDETIVLEYKQTQGEKQSYTIQPFLLLIVDKTYEGEIKVVKN